MEPDKVHSYTHDQLEQAHQHSSGHMAEILSSELCGCFYCLSTFDPSQIDDWIDEDASGTAMCPSCGVDSVIGSASGYTIDPLILTAMRAHWF